MWEEVKGNTELTETLSGIHPNEDQEFLEKTVAEVHAGSWTDDVTGPRRPTSPENAPGVDPAAHAFPMGPPRRTINDRYALLRWLGRGGMGEVFLALDRLTGEKVALKQMAAARALRRGLSHARQEIAGEFQILSGLSHRNIVRAFDYGFDEHDRPFFTMESLDGARDIVRAAVERSMEERLDLVVQMLRALDALHRRGVLHRDVKPANLVVTVDGTVKLLDFGIAIPKSKAAAQRRPTGTISYLAPEIIAGEAPSQATDLFGAGVIAYQVLTGRHPFSPRPVESEEYGTGLAALLDRIARHPADLEALPASAEVRAVLGRLLAKVPADRYAEADEAIRDLRCAAAVPAEDGPAGGVRPPLATPAFVGRRDVFGELVLGLCSARAGRGGAFMVRGAAAAGKTRLLAEARGRAQVLGLAVLEGGLPRILSGLCLAAMPTRDELAALTPWAPGLPALLGRRVKLQGPACRGPACRDHMVTVVRRLVARAGPLLLILEDLDRATRVERVLWRCLAGLCQTLPVVVVGSVRTPCSSAADVFSAADAELAVADAATLRLAPLSDEEMGVMIRSSLDGAGDDLVAAVVRQAGGMPGRALAVLRAVLEAEPAGRPV